MKRGILFVLCFAVLLCVPAFAETVEPDSESGTGLASGSSSGSSDSSDSSTESGTDTVVIEQTSPLEVMEIDDVAAASVTGSGYTGMISDQYRDYFSSIVSKYWGRDYVLYRSGQYTYTLVYDADLEASGTSFTGSGKIVTINTGSYSGGDWSVDWSGEDTVSLTLADVALWSNLGDFPQLEGGEWLEKSAAVVICVAMLAVFASGLLFGRVRS